jgi:hypothetical protein
VANALISKIGIQISSYQEFICAYEPSTTADQKKWLPQYLSLLQIGNF